MIGKEDHGKTEAKQKHYLPREIKALDPGIKQKANICHLDSFSWKEKSTLITTEVYTIANIKWLPNGLLF